MTDAGSQELTYPLSANKLGDLMLPISRAAYQTIAPPLCEQPIYTAIISSVTGYAPALLAQPKPAASPLHEAFEVVSSGCVHSGFHVGRVISGQ